MWYLSLEKNTSGLACASFSPNVSVIKFLSTLKIEIKDLKIVKSIFTFCQKLAKINFDQNSNTNSTSKNSMSTNFQEENNSTENQQINSLEDSSRKLITFEEKGKKYKFL